MLRKVTFVVLFYCSYLLTACTTTSSEMEGDMPGGDMSSEMKGVADTAQLPLPQSQIPIHVSEDMLEELRSVPFAEEPLAADTCLAMTRQEIVPVVQKDGVGFTDFGWNFGVMCPQRPGFICYAPDDGRCICVQAPPDNPEDGGVGSIEIPELPEADICRIKPRASYREGERFQVLKALECTGGDNCKADEACKLRRIRTTIPPQLPQPIAIGCTCVKQE